jgi:hypothetical protein
MHIIVRLFEMNDTRSSSLQLQFLLKRSNLLHTVIAFAMDEGSNLIAMVITLYFIIDYETFENS